MVQEKLLGRMEFSKIETLLKNISKLAKDKKISPLSVLKQYLHKGEVYLKEKKDIEKNQRLIALNKKKDIIQNSKKSVLSNEARLLSNEARSPSNESLARQHTNRMEAFKQTKEAYQKLNPTLRQHTSDELNSKVSTLSPVVRAKLKKNNIAPAEYANFLLSREKIR